MRILILLLIFGLFSSCQEKQRVKTINIPESIVQDKNPEFQYYDSKFELDSTTKLQTDGYYEIKQVFGTYTTDLKTYHTNKPKFGFAHFFNDGFCRIGAWNGIWKNPDDVKNGFKNGRSFIGIYKIENDTIKIEYLYDAVSPGAGQKNNRNTLTGILRENRIDFITDGAIKFSYPNNSSDSLTSSCIGRFKNAEFDKSDWNNYLKEDISKYIKTD